MAESHSSAMLTFVVSTNPLKTASIVSAFEFEPLVDALWLGEKCPGRRLPKDKNENRGVLAARFDESAFQRKL